MTMTVTVLGTAAPAPLPGRPCSGYLLRAGERSVWVDAGFGTLAALRAHADPAALDAVWISHLHADHCADLAAAFYALRYGGLDPAGPIPVYAPAGLAQRLAGFFGRPDTAFLQGTFTFHDLHEGHRVHLGDLVLTAHAVVHDVEAYALRASHAGRTLAYSGDSAPGPGLVAAARAADLFLCEADHDAPPPGRERAHLTPEEAAAAAAEAGAARLLLTHTGPSLTPGRAAARATAALGRPVAHAREGRTWQV
ncbi:MBL fold metallo-hydrolase [Nocardiopsis sp. CC223A]|uniref:MBL fold metallo-hydrolase n=1 Tax=Nocardiopsis sp. CC223A TaxID=3044051 RepID=UPI00278BFB61|nr:MBL fold metallo-hydrolase [Nocardiopsis sp. CC223A]